MIKWEDQNKQKSRNLNFIALLNFFNFSSGWLKLIKRDSQWNALNNTTLNAK